MITWEEYLAIFLKHREIVKWPLKRPQVFQKSLTFFAYRSTFGRVGNLITESVSELGFQNNYHSFLHLWLCWRNILLSPVITELIQWAFIVKIDLCKESCLIGCRFGYILFILYSRRLKLEHSRKKRKMG